MRSRPNMPHPRLRLLAGLALGLFIAAQAFCAARCSGLASCMAAPASSGCHACPGKDGAAQPCSPSASAACANLRTLELAEDAPVVWPASELLLWSLADFLPALNDASAVNHSFLPRPGWSTDRLFTPELSLGPAFRSLPPPSVG